MALNKIIVVYDKNFAGDKNQSLGIADEIVAKYNGDVSIIEIQIDTLEPNKQIKKLNLDTDNTTIIISAGLSGFNYLTSLVPQDNLRLIWSGHQVFSEIVNFNDTRKLPHIMAFPAHLSELIPDKIKRDSNVVLTDGVPHNVNHKTIMEDVKKIKMQGRSLPLIDENSVVIILPGDAPTSSGEMLHFTEADATALAEKIYTAEGKDKSYIVLNGPRTGKHTHEQAHRNGEVDVVTQRFCNKLEELSELTIQLFDFQFNQLPSVYKPVLRAVKMCTSGTGADFFKGLQYHPMAPKIYVPGESTSMVTETIGYLPRNRVIICEVSTMNPTHQEHLKSIAAQGGVKILQNSGEMSTSPSKGENLNVMSAACLIADTVIKLFEPQLTLTC